MKSNFIIFKLLLVVALIASVPSVFAEDGNGDDGEEGTGVIIIPEDPTDSELPDLPKIELPIDPELPVEPCDKGQPPKS